MNNLQNHLAEGTGLNVWGALLTEVAAFTFRFLNSGEDKRAVHRRWRFHSRGDCLGFFRVNEEKIVQ